ncbi:SH3 domain-containing protein [Sphingomonas ginkgonis]|uniref:SH3 domain-containing protein n=1 Tax=Sphingomonas ginkgonis TaxID=2315330 RepID=A0A429V8Z6_9SPHN|nr:SH3 domain-containing protein [Sphingomonas ginkgonis]RST30453.1 SH3 domain-containing protein [Sphingomonas ginkgonis]
MALAGRVIASHYAEPLARRVTAATALRGAASGDGELLARLEPGTAFAMLDCTLGWAWGYAGDERRVGYVREETLGA